jgi:hypothetical protein
LTSFINCRLAGLVADLEQVFADLLQPGPDFHPRFRRPGRDHCQRPGPRPFGAAADRAIDQGNSARLHDCLHFRLGGTADSGHLHIQAHCATRRDIPRHRFTDCSAWQAGKNDARGVGRPGRRGMHVRPFCNERCKRRLVWVEQMQRCPRILQAFGDCRSYLSESQESKLHDPLLLARW